VVGFGQAMERRLCFMAYILWENFCLWGDLILWPNHNMRPKLDRLSWSKKSTIPQSTVGYLFGQRIRCGTERRLCLWQQKLGEKLTLWVWVRHGQLASRRPISMGHPTCTHQTHHNQPWLGWVGAELVRGWRSSCICGVYFFGILAGVFFLMASLNCNRAGKFDCSTRLLASTI
jgi:hypothetical protein